MKKLFIILIAFFAISLTAQAQRADTLYLHTGGLVFDIPTKDVDSIIFYRTGHSSPIGDCEGSVDPPIATPNCNNELPGWGATLGRTSFVTGRTWKLQNGVIGQEWSDVVRAQNCRGKETFNPGSLSATFNADCRQHPNPNMGDFFSFCAASRFREQLCPDGWRVPDTNDFRKVAEFFGAGGFVNAFRFTAHTTAAVVQKLAGEWGATITGMLSISEGEQVISGDTTTGYYWAWSEREWDYPRASGGSPDTVPTPNDGSGAFAFRFSEGATAFAPWQDASKGSGMMVRCVRNIDPGNLPDVLPEDNYVDVATCNTLQTPGWGTTLGAITFASNNTFQVGGNGIYQEWSDAVVVENCNKTTFNGGELGTLQYGSYVPGFLSDCRNNGEFKGSLFSWCAIARFGATLCTGDWRAPTAEDFRDLDIALGGEGAYRTGDGIAADFISIWGGQFNNLTQGTGMETGTYWSADSRDATNAYFLSFRNSPFGEVIPGVASPWTNFNKASAMTFRCIRVSEPEVAISVPSCNNDSIPGFRFGRLGTVRFVTDETWTVGNGTLTQTWSNTVTASGCQKPTPSISFGTDSSETSAGFNSDCRQNTNPALYGGDFFTWCAVARFRDILCPDGWRVPTAEDFANLDIILGGTGQERGPNDMVNWATRAVQMCWYTSTIDSAGCMPWGAKLAGAASSATGTTQVGANFYYWSLTSTIEFDPDWWGGDAWAATLSSNNTNWGNTGISPTGPFRKGGTNPRGMQVRCIKETPDVFAGCNEDACRGDVPAPDANGCNITAEPNYGSAGLGTISFATTETWVVTGHGISQEWSDVVVAENCAGTAFDATFDGGGYKSQCRSNPGGAGSLFSWCAVIRNQATICPAGWRVPINQDFIDLDIALGGTGETDNTGALFSSYTGTAWGGGFTEQSVSAFCGPGFGVAVGVFWSATPRNDNVAHFLRYENSNDLDCIGFGSTLSVAPQGNTGSNKGAGMLLRCIKE